MFGDRLARALLLRLVLSVRAPTLTFPRGKVVSIKRSHSATVALAEPSKMPSADERWRGAGLQTLGVAVN